MPSTADLTLEVSQLRFPLIVSNGTSYVPEEGHGSALSVVESIPIFPLIYRALTSKFMDVSFELILHAIEQLIPISTMRTWSQSSDQFHPAIAAFVELQRQYDLLNDWSLLRQARESMIIKIISILHNRSASYVRNPPLKTLVEALSAEFRIAVFTLNYDDIIDGSREDWFDGFLIKSNQATSGLYWEALSFDAQKFDSWTTNDQPLLVHLHGSVRFGPNRTDFGLSKYGTIEAAIAAIRAVSGGDQSVGGQVVSISTIISGYNKAARLILNPVPYAYYYKALIDLLLLSERLLVIGYGSGDEHVNTWIREYKAIHGSNRRAAWIGLLKGEMVGEHTPEKQMINLLGDGSFEDFRHCNEPSDADRLWNLGDLLCLGANGFPLTPVALTALISFLRK